eukprot:TRINITY_DN25532_c0_g1_i1.p1 TRINITY_DN25532_c0_g1~~TRINITY_DN25532_c0_g1_i1.p1  ORF type:complete len:315 (+),score=92.04 TRINITY_DN25532_c0_g1_i1:68-946(+)
MSPKMGEEAEFANLSAEWKERCRREVEQELLAKMGSDPRQPPPPPAPGGGAGAQPVGASSLTDSQRCPVCYEVMLPPEAAPQMVVPCGHTFCKRCLARLRRHGGKSAPCPTCRTPIQSQVPNHSLRSIVETLADCAHQPGGGGLPTELSPEIERAIAQSVDEDKCHQVRHYLSAFAMADARDRVVAAEEESASGALEEARKQAEVARGVVDYLATEDAALREQLEQLRKEQEAVAAQLGERREVLREAQDRQRAAEDRLGALQAHRAAIGREALKAKAILCHLAPAVDLTLL